MTQKRFLLVALSIILLISFCGVMSSIFQSPQRNQKELFPNRSIYNPHSSGVKAWYQAMRKSGIPVEVWRKSFRQLDELPFPSVMVVIEPFSFSKMERSFDEEAIARLLAWVAEGNTLVLFDRFDRGDLKEMLTELDIEPTKSFTEKEGPQNALIPTDFEPFLKTYLKYPLVTREGVVFQSIEEDKTDILLKDSQGGIYGIEKPYKEGYLILGAAPDLVSNEFLHDLEVDNFQYMTNLLKIEGKPIYINEFVHGYSETPDIFSYYSKTPLGKIWLQLLLFMVVLLWGCLSRWKPAVVLSKEETVPQQQDFIHSLAGIYYRTQAASIMISPLVQDIQSILRKRYRLELEDKARLESILAQAEKNHPQFWPEHRTINPVMVLEKAQQVVRQEKKLPHSELLVLMQRLSSIRESLTDGR